MSRGVTRCDASVTLYLHTGTAPSGSLKDEHPRTVKRRQKAHDGLMFAFPHIGIMVHSVEDVYL